MLDVQTNAELQAFHKVGEGLVFNHFTSGPAGPRDNVLHAAGCPQVGRMLTGVLPGSRPRVRKILFAGAGEAQSWLVSNLGPEGHSWKWCGWCQADRAGAVQSMQQPTKATTGVPGMPAPVALTPVSESWPAGSVFAMPSSQPLQLPVPPRLASWNRASSPDQVRLTEYLDEAEALLRPRLEQLSGPLALRLDVGLPQSAALLDQRDLDNYLFPLAARVSGDATVACVWGTKQHADYSLVRIENAVPAVTDLPPGRCYTVRTSASAQSTAFKEQIKAQLGGASLIPPGPVRIQLAFTVGPARNWLNLWKPTIDALGQILGHAPAAGTWAPLDGRIVDLGLHCRIDPSVVNDVIIAIAATGSS